MSEAVNAIIRYAFSEMGAKHFQIAHAAGNVKTRAIMDKLGFIETDICEKVHKLPNGRLGSKHTDNFMIQWIGDLQKEPSHASFLSLR